MNMPVAEIFGLGKWKSEKSAVRYADEDIIDPEDQGMAPKEKH